MREVCRDKRAAAFFDKRVRMIAKLHRQSSPRDVAERHSSPSPRDLSKHSRGARISFFPSPFSSPFSYDVCFLSADEAIVAGEEQRQ